MDLSNWGSFSPESKLSVLAHNDGKWGWVVYRCSYAAEFDNAWEDFKRRVQEEWRGEVAASSDAGPEVADKMDFVFVAATGMATVCG